MCNYRILKGNDGRLYVVFSCSSECEEWAKEKNISKPVYCFGQLDNAFLFTDVSDIIYKEVFVK